MRANFLWLILFLTFMGVGFLHGVLPQGISSIALFAPQEIQVLTTNESLFPLEVRKELEDRLRLHFSVTVIQDWEHLLANLVASPAADLVFLPSFWANSLTQQGLLKALSEQKERSLLKQASADFIKYQENNETHFFPIYWMKTSIETASGADFLNFLKDKASNSLLLIKDEDLILKHFQIWKEQALLDLILQKKILTHSLDQLTEVTTEGATEGPLLQENNSKEYHPYLNTLYVWGAAIPKNAPDQKTSIRILENLSKTGAYRESIIKSSFNSALSVDLGDKVPLQRRAEHIRDIQLKDTILLESKDQEARLKLKTDFNFEL